MLNRFEPITLPIAMSSRSRKLDNSEVTSSGSLVSPATIVRTMTRWESPQSRPGAPTVAQTLAESRMWKNFVVPIR